MRSLLKGVDLRRKQQRQGMEELGKLYGLPVFIYKGRINDDDRKGDRRESEPKETDALTRSLGFTPGKKTKHWC